MRRRGIVVALFTSIVVGLAGFLPTASARTTGPLREYVVRYEDNATAAEGRAAVRRPVAGSWTELTAIGVARVVSRNRTFFRDAAAEDALAGAATNKVIGYAEPALREKVDEVEALAAASTARSARVQTAEGPSPSRTCSGAIR